MTGHIESVVASVAVNAFIVAYLTFAWSWDLPPDFPLKKFVDRFRPYVRWVGFWHSWAMFAPDPIRENRLVAADIYLANGEVLRWDQPRFDRMDFWAGLLAARERKFLSMLTEETPGFKFLRPAFTDYLARGHTGPGQSPTRVVLKFYLQPILLPGTTATPEWTERVVYSYQLPPAVSSDTSAGDP